MSSFWMDRTHYHLRNSSSIKNGCSHFPNSSEYKVLQNPTWGNNTHTLNCLNHQLSWFFDIHGKMNLEKLVWTQPISLQFTETFDLLWVSSGVIIWGSLLRLTSFVLWRVRHVGRERRRKPHFRRDGEQVWRVPIFCLGLQIGSLALGCRSCSIFFWLC